MAAWRRTGRGVGSILGRGDFGSVWTEKSKIWVLGTHFWGQNRAKSKDMAIFPTGWHDLWAVRGSLEFGKTGYKKSVGRARIFALTGLIGVM